MKLQSADGGRTGIHSASCACAPPGWRGPVRHLRPSARRFSVGRARALQAGTVLASCAPVNWSTHSRPRHTHLLARWPRSCTQIKHAVLWRRTRSKARAVLSRLSFSLFPPPPDSALTCLTVAVVSHALAQLTSEQVHAIATPLNACCCRLARASYAREHFSNTGQAGDLNGGATDGGAGQHARSTWETARETAAGAPQQASAVSEEQLQVCDGADSVGPTWTDAPRYCTGCQKQVGCTWLRGNHMGIRWR